MRIHVLSDLHLEVSDYVPPHVECDVVVLAGDIGKHAQGFEWARQHWPTQEIVYVPGNHEYYRTERNQALEDMRLIAKQFGVFLLDNEEVRIGEVRFLGCTLWTDFELFGLPRQAGAMNEGEMFLNDFRLIREGSELFTPARSIELHKESVEWLRSRLDEEYDASKTVVVSHHLPSMRSVVERYKTSLLSACFASDLNDLMGGAALWIHGHTHDSLDYELNGTRVICNPRGYCRYDRAQENVEFDPGFVVEL